MKRLLLFTLLTLPTTAAARILDRRVAVVNDEIITSTELEDISTPVLRQVDSIPDPVVREQQRSKQLRFALEDRVGQRLITQEAQQHKLHGNGDKVGNHLAPIQKQPTIAMPPNASTSISVVFMPRCRA